MERARPVAPVPVDAARGNPALPREADRRIRWVPLAGLVAVALAAVAIATRLRRGRRLPAAGRRRRQAGGEEGRRGGRAARCRRRPTSRRRPRRAAEEPAEEPASTAFPQPSGAGGTAEAERLHLEGYAALQAGDYDRAIDLNTQAIEAFPEGTTWEDNINYAYALYSLGRALRLAGRPDEAIPVLEARRAIPNQTRRSSTSSTWPASRRANSAVCREFLVRLPGPTPGIAYNRPSFRRRGKSGSHETQFPQQLVPPAAAAAYEQGGHSEGPGNDCRALPFLRLLEAHLARLVAHPQHARGHAAHDGVRRARPS